MNKLERAAMQQALEALKNNNKRLLTGLKITTVNDKSEFEPVYSEPVKRPLNCGTGYCSCIECLYEAAQEPLDDKARDNMLLRMIQHHFPSLPVSDDYTDWGRWLRFANAAFEAGRKDAANVEQEPVAYMFKVKRTLPSSTPLDVFAAIEYHPLPHEDIISKEPLYAAPVQQAEQEPVAWMSPNKERLEFSRKDTVYGSHTIPLYAAPVRTKDMTDDEIADIRMGIIAYDPVEWGRVFARAVIAADREKNK